MCSPYIVGGVSKKAINEIEGEALHWAMLLLKELQLGMRMYLMIDTIPFHSFSFRFLLSLTLEIGIIPFLFNKIRFFLFSTNFFLHIYFGF